MTNRGRTGSRYALLLALLPLGWQMSAFAADAVDTAKTVCAACHGADGNGIPPIFPKLAGQPAEYTAKQLTDYLAGKRKNEAMVPTLAALSAGQIPGLAAYFAVLPPAPGKVEDATLVEGGRKIYQDGNPASGVPGCVGCHEPKGVGAKLNPRLAGQHQTYLLSQLEAFKSGARNNDKARVMRNAVEHLTTVEMKAVAEYLAGQ